MQSRLWIDESVLKPKLFDQKAVIEDSVKLEFIDIPVLHTWNETSIDFLMALSHTDDIDFFGS